MAWVIVVFGFAAGPGSPGVDSVLIWNALAAFRLTYCKMESITSLNEPAETGGDQAFHTFNNIIKEGAYV